MERVEDNGNWTLFSPDETPDLHDLYGNAFAERYAFYEAKAHRGEMLVTRTVRAQDSLAPDADDALRDRTSLEYIQGCLQLALAATTQRSSPFVESLHRNYLEHQQPGDRSLQSGVGEPGKSRYKVRH